jgi:NAD(P)-dependent dehydrogenase (short-subunit alcohol dehydrogenase family)
MTKKYAIIIGFGPGNGMGIARAFGRAGFGLALVARTPVKLRDDVHSLVQSGVTAELLAADASNADSLRAAIAAAEKRFGGSPDVVIYNVVSPNFEPLATLAPDALVNDLKINVIGALVAAQAVLPAMKARRSGSILLTGGGWSLYPTARAASPSIGKAALRSLAFILNEDLNGTGVKAGVITIMGMVKPGTPFDPNKIGDALLAMHEAPVSGFAPEVQFMGS